MLDAIIFDYDGTIGDTSMRQYEWFLYWNKHSNGDAPLAYFSRFAAVGEKEELTKERRVALEDSPGERVVPVDFQGFLQVYNHLYNVGGGQFLYDAFGLPCDMSDHAHPVWKHYERFKEAYVAPAFDGMPQAVKRVWELGHLQEDASFNQRVRLAINTTNSWKSIYRDLSHHGLLCCFDSFVTAETLKRYDANGNSQAIMKPSKIAVALSLSVLGAAGEATMFVGDTLSDLQACTDVARTGSYRKERLVPVGVAWGFDGRDVLMEGVKTDSGQAYFRHIVETPEELVGLVESYVR
ncbi:HAD hydrolase-like protein [Candidatus Woesearchaeota archaeon]|nr:HAD hydrolase-like protein [Candidatus Woesearchaeota archaeon]